MKIMINGQPHEAESQSLSELLVTMGYTDTRVATAVNSEFVPVASRDEFLLSENDHVDIIAPMAGG